MSDANLISNLEEENNIIEIFDNSKRGKIAIYAFWVIIAIDLVAILSGYVELDLLKQIKFGEFVDDSAIDTSDFRQVVLGILQTISYIVCSIIFLYWFRRAYGNLHRLGIKYINHSESMAIWAFVIPIVSLFRPVQIMNEIWVETQNYIKKNDRNFKITNGILFIGFWWLLFIVTNIIGRFILRDALNLETIDDLINNSQNQLYSDILQVVEAFFIIGIVYKISQFEEKLAEVVKRSGGRVIEKN